MTSTVKKASRRAEEVAQEWIPETFSPCSSAVEEWAVGVVA